MTSVGQSILMVSPAGGRGFGPGRTEQKRCLGFVELERNGTHLMFIKAVSIADQRERVAVQRMMSKDVGEVEGTGEDIGRSFSGYSIAIAGFPAAAGRLSIGSILDSKTHRERAEFKSSYRQAFMGSRYNESPSGSSKEDPCE